jgi:hypothetical protein
MKFNVWHYDPKATGPTGGWEYKATVRAKNETEACYIVAFRFSLNTGKLKAYTHIDSMKEVA